MFTLWSNEEVSSSFLNAEMAIRNWVDCEVVEVVVHVELRILSVLDE